jgi:ABC-type sugar transport system substrate-binding protein
MEAMLKRVGGLAIMVLVVGLVAVGCGSSSSSSSSGGSETAAAVNEEEGAATEEEAGGEEEAESGSVEVSVGPGQMVSLPKGKLTIGIFPPATTNEYLKEWVAGAEDTAKEYGWSTVLFDPEFDPNKQLNMAQTAIQQGQIDAAVVQPVDGQVICGAFSKEAVAANILVNVSVNTLCGQNLTPKGEESPEGQWTPGTQTFVGSNNYMGFQEAWFEATAKANPGAKNIALVLGQPTIGQTHLTEAALESYEEKNPEFHISNIINTDYTSADGLAKAQNFLQANPDTEVIMSIYSPDLTRGVLQALSEAGLSGKVAVTDQGGSSYSFEQVENGNLEFTMGYFPRNATTLQVKAIKEAQEGVEVPKYIDDSKFGTVEEPTIITKQNVGQFKPEF